MARNARFVQALCFVGVLATLAAAAPIDVPNSSFEAPDIDSWNDRIVDDWVGITLGGGGSFGLYDNAFGLSGGLLASDGEQKLYMYGDNVSVWQVLSAELDAGIYTLEVDLASFNGLLNYAVELLAGGVSLASSSPLTLAQDIWKTSTVEVGIPTDHPQLGEALEIRISAGTAGGSAQLLADNVQLGYIVPEPTMIVLLTLGAFVIARRPPITR